MIEQIATVLAKILFNKELKQHCAVQQEIENVTRHLIRMPWQFLRSMSVGQLVQLLGYGDRVDKLLAASEFLNVESAILFEQGQNEESVIQGMKALGLYIRVLKVAKKNLSVDFIKRFEELLQRVRAIEPTLALEEMSVVFHSLVAITSE